MTKKYIEPEIIKDEIEENYQKTKDAFSDKYDQAKKFGSNHFEVFEEELKSIKTNILLKGLWTLAGPIAFFSIFLIGFIVIIFLIFDHPFDYIISGIILFFVFKFIYHIIKLIK